MSWNNQCVCDVCGKVKGDVNCWWMFSVAHVLSDTDYPQLEILPWIDAEAEWKKHACGQECLIKVVNRFMQEQATASNPA